MQASITLSGRLWLLGSGFTSLSDSNDANKWLNEDPGFGNIGGNTDFEVETPAGHLEPLERMHLIAAAKLKLSLP
ncbi:hypothetical protein F4803DRAFT_170211 [Xylaria telfairii]|nr:hypothetical protein F4803DRAFT_170211 [Xylaria telfairii]